MTVDIVKNDYNIKSTQEKFDSEKLELAADILAECLSIVYKTDCFMKDDISREVYKDTTSALDQLSVLQLWGKPVDLGNYTIKTSLFEIYSTRVSPDNVVNLTIISEGKPQVDLRSNASTTTNLSQDSEAVDIHAIFWATNIFSCPRHILEDSLPPPVSVSVNEQDSDLEWRYAKELSAKMSYPASNGRNFSNCSSGCSPTVEQDGEGRQFFFLQVQLYSRSEVWLSSSQSV